MAVEMKTPAASERKDAAAAKPEAADFPGEEKRVEAAYDAAPLPTAEVDAIAGEGKEEEKGAVAAQEETVVVADAEDLRKMALDELKHLVAAAIANHEFTKKLEKKAEEPAVGAAEEAGAPEAVISKVAESSSSPAEEEDKTEEVEKTIDEAPPKVEQPGAGDAEVAESSPAAEAPAEPDEKTLDASAAPDLSPEKISLWGVPLLGDDERSDTILLKFLRARDFKAEAALSMLKDAVIWRRDFGTEGLPEEDLGAPAELAKVVFMHGRSREGSPVCYNVYGEFRDRELYRKVLSDDEKRGRFLRWRVQLLERGIRERLDFSSSGVSSIVQVTDLNNAPGPWKRELHQATKQALALLKDNYPEFVAHQVFINVPWWHLAFRRMMSPFLTQRTKSKFVFAGPSKSPETLFKFVAPEQVPLRFGGLGKEETDSDFSDSDAVVEATVNPSAKHIVEIPAPKGTVLVWELRVPGWDVSYGAEFVPAAEDGYTVIVRKSRRFAAADEPSVTDGFKAGEAGKVVLTVDNSTSKNKKRLLYRSKAKNVEDSP